MRTVLFAFVWLLAFLASSCFLIYALAYWHPAIAVVCSLPLSLVLGSVVLNTDEL